MTEKPVTTADREAALASKVAMELPPQPFDPTAGYRAMKKQWREDAAAKPGSLWTNGGINDPVIDPSAWINKPIPPRLWVADQWIPLNTVTALYGDGGTGKSLVAQGLMTACALGMPWLGIPTAQCRAFGYFCEDDEDELHRRQDAINRALGCGYADLEPMRLQSRVGLDNVLMNFSADGVGFLTPAFDDLCTEIMDHKARLATLDTAADTFGGNENIRPQVRQFIGHCLGKLAKQMRGAVLLLAHPSRAGLASGEGDGGNTAWNASVRSRLYLSRPKADSDDQPDDNRRILTRKKANYAGRGDAVDLIWQDGYFAVERAATGIFSTIAKHSADDVFMDALQRLNTQGRNVSESPHSGNFAPKVIAASGMAKGLRKPDLRAAMERLFAEGRIKVERYGRDHDQRRRVVVVQHAE